MSGRKLVTVTFESIASGLLFLKRSLPRKPSEIWKLLQGCRVSGGAAHGPFSITLPSSLVSEANAQRSLVICGGKVSATGAGSVAADAFAIEELFRNVAFEPSGLTEQSRRFLVIPRAGDSAFPRLISVLASLAEWRTTLHANGDDSRGHFLLLESINGMAAPLPIALPRGPFVLAELGEDVFGPPGMAHPLLPDYRFLFPLPEPGVRHAWTINPIGVPEYFRLREAPDSGVPLARRVSVAKVRTSGVVPAIAAAPVEIALELHKSSRRGVAQRSNGATVYRIETQAGEFGPALLRFLDHAEAGIENFTYYLHPRGEGPNAPVDHYLLTAERISDEQTWPEVERFYCPPILEELNLPIFVPDGCHFAPDLDGLLRAADADEPLLKQLGEATGFPPAGAVATADVSPAISIILTQSTAREWIVLRLENGRPLAEAIRATSTAYNRQRIRRVLKVDLPGLSEERKNHEERWIAAGIQEAAEINSATEQLSRELANSAASMDRDLAGHEARLKEVQGVIESAAAMVTEHLPQGVRIYSDQTTKILASLAEPQRVWLKGLEERRAQLEQLRNSTLVLQREAAQEVEQLNTESIAGERAIVEAQQQLGGRMAALESAANALANSVARAEAAAREAEVAMAQRRAALNRERSRIEAEERGLLQENARLDAFQSEVEQNEAAVAEHRRQLGIRRRDLERRLQQVREARQESEAEEARLKRLETVEIPAQEKLLAEVRAKVSELLGLGIDASLAGVVAELNANNTKLADLEKLQKQLDGRREELARAKARRVRIEAEIGNSMAEIEADESGEKKLGVESERSLKNIRDAFEAILVAKAKLRMARQFFAQVNSSDRTRAENAIKAMESQATELEQSSSGSKPEGTVQANAPAGEPAVPVVEPQDSAKTSWFKRLFGG
jgi:hypothetical protein